MSQTLLTIILMLALAMPASWVQAKSVAPKIAGKAAIAIESHTGKILVNQNADERLKIASMTKLISLYLIYQAIDLGHLNREQKITIDEETAKLSSNMALSNVKLTAGKSYSVQSLIEATEIYSANGATVALAKAISGSEASFIEEMKDLLESWGIHDYQLVSSTGLPNYYGGNHDYPDDAENELSARHVALVAQHLILDYPEILEVASVTGRLFAKGTPDEVYMENYNLMLPGMKYERRGVDGLKTGTTDAAGANFTGTAEEGGLRLITVVMGVADHEQRFIETAKLMDYCFDHYELVPLIETDEKSNQTIQVINAKQVNVPLRYGRSLAVVLEKGAEISALETSFQADPQYLDEKGRFTAPLDSGTRVGSIVIKDNFSRDNLGYVDDDTALVLPALTMEASEKAGKIELLWRDIKALFQ